MTSLCEVTSLCEDEGDVTLCEGDITLCAGDITLCEGEGDVTV